MNEASEASENLAVKILDFQKIDLADKLITNCMDNDEDLRTVINLLRRVRQRICSELEDQGLDLERYMEVQE